MRELGDVREERKAVEERLEKAENDLKRITVDLGTERENVTVLKGELASSKEEVEKLVRQEAELRRTAEETEEALGRLNELVKEVQKERDLEKEARLASEEAASELSDDKIRLESELAFLGMERQRLEDRMEEYKSQMEEAERRSCEKDNLLAELKHELSASSTNGRESVNALESTRTELMATKALLGATRQALTVARKENEELRGTTKSGG
ncbi:hypothetical protein FOL47_002331 [Perkinsus chesapeaki]|uniref:Uncharacterized protein n=1 Tax=Perkinsus chesapeaki TaxID=330153 RepID=A0A7J6KPF0_PERCH|nr:hypothetical protein FOL47_002331 [Perkinsus chesapeaki]